MKEKTIIIIVISKPPPPFRVVKFIRYMEVITWNRLLHSSHSTNSFAHLFSSLFLFQQTQSSRFYYYYFILTGESSQKFFFYYITRPNFKKYKNILLVGNSFFLLHPYFVYIILRFFFIFILLRIKYNPNSFLVSLYIIILKQ